MPGPARRVSRRRALVAGGAVLATGAAAVATGALVRRNSTPTNAGTTATATPPSRATTSPTATATAPTSTPVPRGGVARLAAVRSFNFDTFDSQRTGEPSVVEVLGRTHSRIVQWSDFGVPTLGPDLAARWEQPDTLTHVFHLELAASWQGASGGARPVTAADLAAHLERMRQLAATGKLPAGQGADGYASISRVSAVDAKMLQIETSRPDPFLLHALGGRFALVQSSEAIAAFDGKWTQLRPEAVRGSGPFRFVERKDNTLRFEAFRDGHRPPNLDGLAVSAPGGDDIDRFIAGDLDEVTALDRRDAPRARSSGKPFTELPSFRDGPVISTFFAGVAPWNNPELLRALSGALNRAELATRLFGGRATASGLVTPATPSFALTGAELSGFPGYRNDFEVDKAEAKRRWAAAGGPALGTVMVEFPSIFDPLYSASSVVVGMLNEVLGAQFRASVDTYTAISDKVANRYYGNGRAALWFGWAPPLASPDPSLFVLDALGAQGAAAAAMGISGSADPQLGRIATEFDIAARRQLARDAQRKHLEAGSPGIITWLLQRDEVFRNPKLLRAIPSPFWGESLDAGEWLG